MISVNKLTSTLETGQGTIGITRRTLILHWKYKIVAIECHELVFLFSFEKVDLSGLKIRFVGILLFDRLSIIFERLVLYFVHCSCNTLKGKRCQIMAAIFFLFELLNEPLLSLKFRF